MGILVCIDEFTYDVVDDMSLVRGVDTKVVGFDNSCQWEKIVIEEPLPVAREVGSC